MFRFGQTAVRCLRESPGACPMSEAGTTMAQLSSALALLAAGHPDARIRLLEQAADRLRRLASRALRVKFEQLTKYEQTDDVLQDLYLRLHKGWDGVLTGEDGRPVTDPAVFLCRVSRLLREVLLDLKRRHYGRNNNRPGQTPLDGGGSTSDGGFDPGTDTHDPAGLVDFGEFHQAVEQLPEDLRVVVDLHYYQEIPHPEVGKMLGLSEIGVRKRWTRARLAVIERLGGENLFIQD